MSSFEISALPLQRNVPLADYTTMRIGGPADYFAEPSHEEQLLKLLSWANEEKHPCFVLGNGSNVIFDDEGFRGLVLSLRRFENDLVKLDLDTCKVTVSAGVSLSRLVRFCQESGLAGTEFLVHIPGTVGGALAMNAGFSRHSGQLNAIGDLVDEIRAVTPAGAVVHWGRAELKFAYRQSNVGDLIVLEAVLRLWRRPQDQIRKELNANMDFRRARQNVQGPNAGSVFKNPQAPHPTAGYLIDQAGLKGKRIGGIQISEQHANYFVNLGGATCADVRRLIEEVQKTVLHETGIVLEPEIRVVAKN